MKRIIFLLLITASGLNLNAQQTITVNDKDLGQMNRLLGVYGAESIIATFWQIENLSYLFINEAVENDLIIKQLDDVVALLTSGNTETETLMMTELWNDESLMQATSKFIELRRALIAEALLLKEFIQTRDESLIEQIEANRAIVNNFFASASGN